MRVSGTTPAPTRYSALVAHPHSGWMNSSASGSSATRALRSAPLMPAWTWHSPSQMCMFSRPSSALHVGAEELVGAEQHLGVLGDRRDDVDGVRRRAADVGLGLHRRGRVDVADDDGAGVLGLPRPQLLGGDRLGQAAPGAFVGDQHRLVVAEDLGRLGHEVDAAEHDRRRLGLRRDPGQAERVADVVGDVLDLGELVVVGEDHGIALPGELADLLSPVRRQPLADHRPGLPEDLARCGHVASVELADGAGGGPLDGVLGASEASTTAGGVGPWRSSWRGGPRSLRSGGTRPPRWWRRRPRPPRRRR